MQKLRRIKIKTWKNHEWAKMREDNDFFYAGALH